MAAGEGGGRPITLPFLPRFAWVTSVLSDRHRLFDTEHPAEIKACMPFWHGRGLSCKAPLLQRERKVQLMKTQMGLMKKQKGQKPDIRLPHWLTQD
jgi:hypothetical protein